MNTGQNLRFAFCAVVVLCSFALIPAGAEDRGSANPPTVAAEAASGSLTPNELIRFEEFLDQHPIIAARLRDNPDIASDPFFQKNNPVFARFLNRHPGFGAALAARPRWFIHRELVRESASPVSAAQVAEFDRFLDQNPRLEKLLEQNPKLLRHPDFVSTHLELHEYLKRHPGLDRAAETKRSLFIRRERKN